MSWGSDQLGVTEETFEVIKAATSGITVGTGIAGVIPPELISLVPVDTPFFNSTARRSAGSTGGRQGARFVFWETLLNVNNSQPDIGVPFDQAGQLVQIENQYVSSQFAPMSLGGTVSEDALATGQGLADVLAVDTLQTINQVLIGMDIHQLGAQNFPLPTIGTPSLSASGSGGSIAGGTTVYVMCAARSLVNYYRGGSGTASSGAGPSTASTGGSTNSVVASVAAVKGASAYDWYVGSSSGAEVYYTTTTVNTVTITSIPTTPQLVPSLSGIFNAGQTGPAAVPTSDASYQSFWQNGLLPSILADYAAQPDQLGNGLTFTNLTTPGGGTTQGAYYKSLDGAQLSVSGAALEQIDEMNRAIYDTYQLTPTRMLMGSQSITDIANALLDNPQAVTWLLPNDASGRARLVAGGAVAIYLNKTVNGKPIVLELQPHLPPGVIIAVVDEVPFPGSNVMNPIQVETLIDFWRFDYGASRNIGQANGGPRYDFEIRSLQAFECKAAPVMGVISNIGAGIA
jgi:hypothetical protein